MRRIFTVLGLAALLIAPGCATVMSGKHAEVTFLSNVPHASVIVRDKHGEQVAVTQTQSKVALKRNDRIIFPARYTATFTAPGYQPADVAIQSKVNPWVLGNIVIGGVPGLAVDNVTGAAWTPKQTAYYQELLPASGPQFGPVYSATEWPTAISASRSLANHDPFAPPPYTASATSYVTPGAPSTLLSPPTTPMAYPTTSSPAGLNP